MKFELSKEGIHVGAEAYDALLVEEFFWRRRADSNRRIEVVQTSALDHLATSPSYSNHTYQFRHGAEGGI